MKFTMKLYAKYLVQYIISELKKEFTVIDKFANKEEWITKM